MRNRLRRFFKRNKIFDAVQLFSHGEGGFLYHHQDWYDQLAANDPVLFKGNDGAEACTAIGDIIGLRLDRRLGLVRGSEALNSPNFETPADWSTSGGSTVSVGSARILSSDGSFSSIFQPSALTVGDWYEMVYTVTDKTSGSLRNDAESGTPEITSTVGTHTRIFRAAGNGLQITRFSGITDVTLSSVSVKSLAGNHAIQSTSASRARLARHPRRGIVNLLTKTEKFDAGWTNLRSSLSANALAAPNGTITAAKFLDSTDSSSHRLWYSSVFLATGVDRHPYIYAKAGELDQFELRLLDTSSATVGFGTVRFDLSSGTVLTGDGTIEDAVVDFPELGAGSGWYKCVATGTTNTAEVIFNLQLAKAGTASFVGTGTDGIYIWGADLADVDEVTPYQRVDNPWDVIEDSRTRRNLLTYTEEFDNAVYTKDDCSITADAVAAPDGSITADKVVPNSTSAYHRVRDATSLPAAQTAYSLYVKAAEYSKIGIRESTSEGHYATFDVSNGTILDSGTLPSPAIEDAGDGWYRISGVYGGSFANTLGIYILDDSYTTGSPHSYLYSGDGSSGLYIWGAQAEQAASASDYQPVTTWYSAQEVDAANGRHIYYIRPDGTDDYFTIPGSASSCKFLHDGTGGTFAAAVQFGTTGSDPQTVYALAASRSASSQIGFFTFWDDRASVEDRLYLGASNGTSNILAPQSANEDAPAGVPCVIRSQLVSQSGDDLTGYVNGQKVIGADPSGSYSAADATNDVRLYSDTGSVFMAGHDYGMVAVEGDLSPTKARSLDEWLTLQFGEKL